jgi:hypothetical protein
MLSFVRKRFWVTDFWYVFESLYLYCPLDPSQLYRVHLVWEGNLFIVAPLFLCLLAFTGNVNLSKLMFIDIDSYSNSPQVLRSPDYCIPPPV